MLETGYYTASIVIQSIALAALIGTLIFFGLQWHGTRHEANLRMRPYLGFDDIAFRDTDKDDVIELDAWITNYGNIPAVNATAYGEFVVNNNKENAPFRCATKGAVFPSARERWLVGVKEIDRKSILSGEKTLVLMLNIEYFSSEGKKYITKTSRTLDYERMSWADVECEIT